MVKLRVVIEHRLMPTSMKYALIHKGLEQLYYSLLFSSPGYKTSPQKWSQWLKMGFGVSIKEQPRAAARDDKLRFSTTSDGPKMELAITQGEDGVLKLVDVPRLVQDWRKRWLANVIDHRKRYGRIA